MFSIRIWLGLLALVSLAAWAWKSNLALSQGNQKAKLIVNSERTIRTYMNFAQVIDPARILTMADLELSVALGTTLVTFDKTRQPVAALAEKWTTTSSEIIFHLKPSLKWSDGSPVTAKDYAQSLARAQTDHGPDLKALFDSVTAIEARSDRDLAFRFKGNVGANGILLKLTEPMYSLLSVRDGKVDYAKSSGPFRLSQVSVSELVLERNPYWIFSKAEMPDRVEIRRPVPGKDLVQDFAADPWPNLVSGTSLIKADVLKDLSAKGFSFWQRTLDKVFSLYPSKAFLDQGGRDVVLFLAHRLEGKNLLPEYGGLARAEQYFPRGYELWSPKSPQIKSTSKCVERKLRILIPESAYAQALKLGLEESIRKACGVTPEVTIIPLATLDDRMKKGDFDLLGTGIAVADANFEGAMSFFFERTPPFIQSGKAPFDFAKQLEVARGLPLLKDRAARMRDVILHSQESGFVLPIFHFSSLAIAKSGVDLSDVPNTDETVMFSKVRMK